MPYAATKTWRPGKTESFRLEDQTQKCNGHLLKRIVQEDKQGIVIEKGETLNYSEWWIKFSVAKILLETDEVIIL